MQEVAKCPQLFLIFVSLHKIAAFIESAWFTEDGKVSLSQGRPTFLAKADNRDCGRVRGPHV